MMIGRIWELFTPTGEVVRYNHPELTDEEKAESLKRVKEFCESGELVGFSEREIKEIIRKNISRRQQIQKRHLS